MLWGVVTGASGGSYWWKPFQKALLYKGFRGVVFLITISTIRTNRGVALPLGAPPSS